MLKKIDHLCRFSPRTNDVLNLKWLRTSKVGRGDLVQLGEDLGRCHLSLEPWPGKIRKMENLRKKNCRAQQDWAAGLFG